MCFKAWHHKRINLKPQFRFLGVFKECMEWKSPCYWSPLRFGSNVCSVFRQMWSPECRRTSFSTAAHLEREVEQLSEQKVCEKLREKPVRYLLQTGFPPPRGSCQLLLLRCSSAAVQDSIRPDCLLLLWGPDTHKHTDPFMYERMEYTCIFLLCVAALMPGECVWVSVKGVCELTQACLSVCLDRLWGQNRLIK